MEASGNPDGRLREDIPQLVGLGEYQQLARITQNKEIGFADTLTMTSMGLAGESGEVADHIKKAFFHSHPLDRDHLVKELGDILWYVAIMAQTLGTSLETVATKNIEKLKARYPEGFNSKASINRKD